jgi:suppressor for copper-sensitivity B
LRVFELGRPVLAAALLFGWGHGAAAATPWSGDAHASVQLFTATRATATVDTGLEIRRAPGWHAYRRSTADAGIRPNIEFAGSKDLARPEIARPARYSPQDLETAGYEQHLDLPIAPILAAPPRPLVLR